MPLFGPPDVKKLEAKKDIKGLIRALEYERDKENERRRLSGSSYARGATKDVERIQRNTKRASDIRESAAQAPGKLSNPDAVMPLIDALDDNDRVYQVAADALAQLKDSRAIAPLVKQICCAPMRGKSIPIMHLSIIINEIGMPNHMGRTIL